MAYPVSPSNSCDSPGTRVVATVGHWGGHWRGYSRSRPGRDTNRQHAGKSGRWYRPGGAGLEQPGGVAVAQRVRLAIGEPGRTEQGLPDVLEERPGAGDLAYRIGKDYTLDVYNLHFFKSLKS